MLNQDINNNDDDKEVLLNEEETNEETTTEGIVTKKSGFFPRLIAAFIDQTISIGLAVGLLYLFDAIIRLKFIGYFVSDRTSVFFIIYVIVNVLYPSITESTKLNGTFGKWLLKIK